MYTEDDDKVKVKKNNSNNDIDDFYTAFNDEDEEKDKKKKKSKKTPKKKFERREVKEETDYSDFYGIEEDSEEKEEKNDDSNIGKIIRIGIIVVLMIVLIILLIILLGGGKSVKGDIELTNKEISLTVGNSDYISYKIIDTDSDVISEFISSNPSVAMVDENGKITAVGDGEAIITIKYDIEGKKGEKECKVIVTGGKTVDQSVKLNITFDNGTSGKWSNKNVTIAIKAESVFGIESVKYATNCSGTCDYKVMSGDKLTIENSGETKITVLATDNKKQEITKEVVVKIDKESPTVTYNGKADISGDDKVQVCVECSDSLSGCKQKSVCKSFTSSKSNQVITVYDNAGNSSNSKPFNVTVNTKSDPCKLSVSNDGTVTATLREEATYYGFNSSYSGPNEKSKKLDIKTTLKDDNGTIKYNGAQVVYYYVKNTNGSGGICVATVIKECSCKDKTSQDVNCELTCTYRVN